MGIGVTIANLISKEDISCLPKFSFYIEAVHEYSDIFNILFLIISEIL